MPRPCSHSDSSTPVNGCRFCELWSEYPEYYAIWEGIGKIVVPKMIQDLRDNGSPALWRSLTAVQNLAKQHGKMVPNVDIKSTDMPSILQQAVNYGKAVVQHVAAGSEITDDEELARRRSICLLCEFISENMKCKKCGCPIADKTAWKEQKCPLPVPKW